MATRFYLPSSGSAAISPAYAGDWESTAIAARLPMATTKAGSAMTDVSVSGDTNLSNQDHLFRQYVSAPIGAQTLGAQAIRFQIRASETAGGNNLFTALTIRVFAPDATTVRGTVLALTVDDTEVSNGSLINRALTATSSSVTAQDGDYLVAEIGLSGDPLSGGHNGSMRIGDAAASDLAQDDSSTSDNNPWIEFANTITFSSGAVTPKTLAALGVG